jgi:hypothetical protein
MKMRKLESKTEVEGPRTKKEIVKAITEYIAFGNDLPLINFDHGSNFYVGAEGISRYCAGSFGRDKTVVIEYDPNPLHSFYCIQLRNACEECGINYEERMAGSGEMQKNYIARLLNAGRTLIDIARRLEAKAK